MMKTLYVVLVLLLTVVFPVRAQGGVNESDSESEILCEMGLTEELWEPIPDLSEEAYWTDCSVSCDIYDILLWLIPELFVVDEDVYGIFSGLWEPECGFYPLWEDDWLY